MIIRAGDRAFHTAGRLALDSPNEIGGILVGWWEDGKTAVIHEFVVVPDIQSGTNHYERGHKGAQKLLTDLIHELEDPKIGYIGEWHSHPAPQPPSRTDRNAIADIVRENGSPVVLVVLAVAPNRNILPFGLIGRNRWLRHVSLEDAPIERFTYE
ncbi:Mov34/MPN/PAD-1 family protein [Corynebacterium sp. YIM 101645]|uniref:Mov34/MPN/PAD-1 family protein n=1 Tax=Corynebacterium lemuris TaxID=1859292 RepID=A0ABT2FZF5_9CORY|nr:Mov34/MPN/PAD-1 family protein [Corynebacterium lemuris]MCS5480616.1 Mov34/MPN/PAD-1 family protein [Corynebacterium lemuris]